MKVLVVGHAIAGKISDNFFNVLTAACQLNAKCDVLILGESDLGSVHEAACIGKILHFSALQDSQLQAVFVASSLATLARSYTHVLTASDSVGKDILPRVAGILEMGQISEVIGIGSPNVFKRPMYAGNVVAEVESFDEVKLLTIRPSSFTKYSTAGGGSNDIEKLDTQLQPDSRTKFISQDLIHNDTIDLGHAKIVVSGGRSLGSKENFDQLIHGLALKMGAAVGASRAAVEAGYAPNDCQVGQTGKVVAPELYLAIGVSGAVQHIAGMKDSKTVVAINLDPNAQIFEYSDYGLTGDLFEIIPQLLAGL